MRIREILLIAALLLGSTALAQPQQFSYSVERIWGNGKHCAFTSLEFFKGNYYCTFREAESHIFDSDGEARGAISVLRSADGEKWESIALITKEGYDLRDPKLSITPDGRLMLLMGGSIYRNKQLTACLPQVTFSSDGKSFDEIQPIELDKKMSNGHDWLWRVTWHEGVAWGVSYSKAKDNEIKIHLMRSDDGVKYSLHKSFEIDDYPNETTVRFLPDGRMALLIRRDKGDRRAYWATSSAPYTKWETKKLELHIGGPDFIVVDDDKLIAAGRTHLIGSAPKTTILTGNNAGRFVEAITLPSGGDTSYPGFLMVGDELWVSYYSTHSTPNASIYLAKIPMSYFRQL